MTGTLFLTGAGGFLAGHTANYFLSQGWSVIGLFHQDRLRSGNEQALKLHLQKESLISRIKPEHRERFIPIDGDILDADAMWAVFEMHRPDAMMHAAALLVPPTEKDYPNPVQFRQEIDKYIEINQASALADCAASYQQQVPHFYCLLVSTIFVFHRSAGNITEESPRVSISDHVYGHSKNEAERYWLSTGLNFAILYPTNIYGAHQHTPAIMTRLMHKMLFNQGEILPLSGEMNPIHVNNMTMLLYMLCETKTPGNFCIAGDGVSMSMEEIALALQEASKEFLAQYNMTPYNAYVIEPPKFAPLPLIEETKLLRFFNIPHIRADFKEQAKHMVAAMWQHKTDLLKAYCAMYYPDLVLTEVMHRQFYWLYNNSVNTSQSHPQVRHVSNDLNQEIKRVLARLQNLRLLQAGTATAYDQFVAAQPVGNTLILTQFQQWSQMIQELSLSVAVEQCLVASCFITKSDEAIQAAKKLPEQVSGDSERFITDVVTQAPTLFPICEEFITEAQHLLQYVYLRNSHGRQMLDMEGGQALFDFLRQQIKESKITREQYELWFARWVLNISGLKGHVEPRGACYFTKGLAESLNDLKQTLDILWTDPEHNVYLTYLNLRKTKLGVSHLYLAQLGTMLRVHTPDKGAEIQAWFDSLSPSAQAERVDEFETRLLSLKMTPTYKPVVLDNLLGLECTIAEALTIFSQIESKAMRLYEQAIRDNQIKEDIPLCYREFAYADSLEHLIAYYDDTGEIPDFTLDCSHDMAMLAKIPEYEKQHVYHPG